MRGKFQKISAGLCGLAVVVATVTVAAPAASAAEIAPTSVQNVVNDSNQQSIIDTFNGINAFRASKNLTALTFSVPISGVSQKWSNTMAATDTFYHNPDYVTGTPDGYLMASEIIAARWDRSGQGLVDQWVNSPGHNAIMSTPEMTTVGIGIAYTDGVAGVTPNRYAMYGTANLFQYNGNPTGTYASPADYFAGKPPLAVSSTSVTPTPPTFNPSTYTIPAVTGVRYTVNGVDQQAGTYNVTDTFYNVHAYPLPGYYFPSGVDQWATTYAPPATTTITVPDPIFNDGASTFGLQPITGVEYLIDGQVWPAGTYFSAQVVNIQVRATQGFTLDPSRPTSWTHDFTPKTATPPPPPAPAPTVITPIEPAFNAIAGTYTIPAFEGVDYKINGVIVRAGTYNGTGIITVTAAPKTGYLFTTGSVTSWSGNITKVLMPVTAAAPTANTTAGTYTIPAVNGAVYKVANVQKIAGTYPGAGSVVVTAQALPGYVLNGTSTWTLVLPKPPVVRSGDLLAADASGTLWNYGNNSTKGRTSIGTGYSTAKKIFAVDWNSDGIADVLTQWKSGSVTLNLGTKEGTLAAAKVVGAGWGSYEVVVGKYNRADKYPSIIAKDTDGNLWNYTNTSGTGINARVLKGGGWKALQVNLVDWDRDGNMDILAKDSSGKLLLYRTDGLGKFKNETRKVVGSGWGPMQMHAIKDYTSIGSQGFLVRDAAGTLYYYGTGGSAWIPRIAKGGGWLPMNIAG